MVLNGWFSFLVTSLIALCIPLSHLALIWIGHQRQSHIRQMFASFAVGCGVLLLTMMQTSAIATANEVILSLSWYFFLCLLYLEAFSMLCRGFSLTILCDVANQGALSADELINQYGEGKGAAWLLEKRIQSMAQLGLVCRNHNTLNFGSHKAYVIARVTLLYKHLFRLGAGG